MEVTCHIFNKEIMSTKYIGINCCNNNNNNYKVWLYTDGSAITNKLAKVTKSVANMASYAISSEFDFGDSWQHDHWD
jgi:hypothetical protein